MGNLELQRLILYQSTIKLDNDQTKNTFSSFTVPAVARSHVELDTSINPWEDSAREL